MDKKLLEKMFNSAVHIGHRKHKWNPKMKKFIYCERNGVHVINLEKTAEYLAEALKFLAKNAAEGKNVLFVSTKPQSINLIKEKADDCGMPYVVGKWIPGLLTNYSTLKVRIKYLADLKDQKETGEFSKYTKKEAAKLNKLIDKLQMALGGVQNMSSRPDVVFVVDLVRDAIVVKEAQKLGIPVVGIADTNADPSIDFPIPGNDDALPALKFFLGEVSGVVKESRKAKK